MDLTKLFGNIKTKHDVSISNQHFADDNNKVKHLLDLSEEILAVFTIVSSQISEIYVTKNSPVDRKWLKDISNHFALEEKSDMNVGDKKCARVLLGKLRWAVLEYDNTEIIKILEPTKTIVVVVKTAAWTLDTIKNILGYYYDKDEQPVSLFD